MRKWLIASLVVYSLFCSDALAAPIIETLPFGPVSATLPARTIDSKKAGDFVFSFVVSSPPPTFKLLPYQDSFITKYSVTFEFTGSETLEWETVKVDNDVVRVDLSVENNRPFSAAGNWAEFPAISSGGTTHTVTMNEFKGKFDGSIGVSSAKATIEGIHRYSVTPIPELDPEAAVSAFMLLMGGVLVLTGARQRPT